MSRPAKLDYETKQAIVNDYYLIECEYNPEKLEARGIYTALAEFANRKGYPAVRSYDFSRDEQVQTYIQSLCIAQQTKTETITTVFTNFDIEKFFRQDISQTEKRRMLSEYEVYVQKQLSIAENNKSLFSRIQSENNTMKEQLDKAEQERMLVAKLNKELAERNKSLERYIRDVLPEEAEKILNKPKDPDTIVAFDIAAIEPSVSEKYKGDLAGRLSILK